VTNLGQSALAVRAYQLLPYDLAGYVGYALPIIEIVIGLLLVLGLFTRMSALLGALLMLAFVIGIASAWARGLSIDCGCFGGGGTIGAEETAYPLELSRDVALTAGGGVAGAASAHGIRPRRPDLTARGERAPDMRDNGRYAAPRRLCQARRHRSPSLP
jgi:hypothetical protein